jgi:hypothetical protein
VTQIKPDDETSREILAAIYRTRPCEVCRHLGWCGHREPQVDLAETTASRSITQAQIPRSLYPAFMRSGLLQLRRKGPGQATTDQASALPVEPRKTGS